MGIQEERCPNCARLEARVAELEAELRTIKALLGLDSTTWSAPRNWTVTDILQFSGRMNNLVPKVFFQLN